MGLLKNIRFYILLSSFFISTIIYYLIENTVPSGTIQTIKLTQTYALIAISYLYLSLLIGPFQYRFKNFPFRIPIHKARRAIGVSAFYFGLLHAYSAFFNQLGGFSGLAFLNQKYIIAITFSFTALFILFLMTITSFDIVIAKMQKPRWKILHRFVYLAGILILIHALLLGSHFKNISELIPSIFTIALVFLLYLEIPRIINFLRKNDRK